MTKEKVNSYMSYFDERIVARGYDYYSRDFVLEIEQTDTYEYKGLVEGSEDKPYSVTIKINEPLKSSCDCPYAESGNMCKHMAALWMAAFPEKADYYEDYDDCRETNHDYYEEEREMEYSLDKSRICNSSLTKLLNEGFGILYYDELLDDFLDNMTPEELRMILRVELMKDKKETFNKYLKHRYSEFIGNKNGASVLLDKLNSRLILLQRDNDSEWKDYSQPMLSDVEKRKISSLWRNKEYRSDLNELFMKDDLAVYDDYRWIAEHLSKHLSKEQKKQYVTGLNDRFARLKSMGIRNTCPKSNVLIAICIIEKPEMDDMVSTMIKNAKYKEYICFCIESAPDVKGLYCAISKEINKKPLYNKQYIPFLLNKLYEKCGDKEILKEYYLYDYLNNNDTVPLQHLKDAGWLSECEKRIEKLTKNLGHLVTLYRFTDEKEKLFNLLNEKGSRFEIIRNVDFLAEKYEPELKKFFTNSFFSSLTGEKSRKIYHEAAEYIKGLIKLEHGEKYVDDVIEQLKLSQYEKCRALFEEIDFAAGRKKEPFRF